MTAEGGKDKVPSPGDADTEKIYWCDVCRSTFATKRCPQCGLKLKRVG